jgi:hypothetical protein
MPPLAAGLVAIAEEGSTAHLLARASSPASQQWGKGSDLPTFDRKVSGKVKIRLVGMGRGAAGRGAAGIGAEGGSPAPGQRRRGAGVWERAWGRGSVGAQELGW